MKTEELTEIGLTEEQAKQVFALNGKDIEKHKKRITELETERDNFKTQLDTANETLKKFDGIDPAKMQDEIETYKTKAANAEKEYAKKIAQRDQRDWVNTQLDKYGVTSPYARKQLAAECMSEDSGLTWKDNSFYGFDDFMKAAKKNDPSLYKTEEEKAAEKKAEESEENKPHFTLPKEGEKPPAGGEKKHEIPKLW